uniref:Ig-like domain-containing protein n=1 Tax=Seriola lalandi dorsalis TaxID=1841481 RepID=A0A3B4YGH3_SERLL
RITTTLSVLCVSGVLCEEFMVTLPKTIEVLKGSCVTIPCSFEIPRRFQNNLDNTCKTIWKNKDEVIFTSDNPNLITTKEMTGDLTRKNCTTTFNNMRLDHTNDYYFRLNSSKCNFLPADPPSPTLTPSTLEETEGTSVRLKCSAPAPCLSQPPTLTWTPGLGDSQETLQENQDKTKVMTSVLTFTASHLHHGKTISCTATYNKQDVILHVSDTPKSTTVSVRPSGPVPEDTNVTLTCTSDAKPAVRNYTWYRADGGQETFIGTGQTLNITASKLTAAFICMAENLLGTGRSNISQIDVQCIDVVYSTVHWKRKSKKKQEDSVDMVPPGTSYLEEERRIVGDMGRNFVSHALEMSLYAEVEPKNVKEEVECEYAQVKFKDKSAKSK